MPGNFTLLHLTHNSEQSRFLWNLVLCFPSPSQLPAPCPPLLLLPSQGRLLWLICYLEYTSSLPPLPTRSIGHNNMKRADARMLDN